MSTATRYAPPSSANRRPRANPVPTRRSSPASANAPQMFAIDDFGRPSRRDSSLGPSAAPPSSARASRIAAARVTAGASDSPEAPSRASSTGAIAIELPFVDSMLARVPHLDYGGGTLYCPAHRRVFSMLDDGTRVKRRASRAAVAVPLDRGSD